MIPRSIQFRLQLWHGVLLTAVLTGLGWIGARMLWTDEVRRVDALLASQLELVLYSPDGRGAQGPRPGRGPGPGPGGPPPNGRFGPPPGGPGGPPPRIGGPDPDPIRVEVARNIWQLERRYPGFYFAFIDHDGTVFARSSNAPPAIPFPANERFQRESKSGRFIIPVPESNPPRFRTRGEFREAYRVLPLNDAILVGRDLEPEWSAFLQRMLLFALAGLALLACGLAGGWWLTREALRPIDDMTHAAQRIAQGDWSQRIDTQSAADELGELAGVLNSTFGQLQQSFERQARFTSDASHELRTPLSVILSKTQTVLARERTPAEYQDALRVCQKAASRMRALTEKLLLLSRQDSGAGLPDFEAVDLAQITRESLDLMPSGQFETNLESVTVHGDAIRLGQLVANLAENAVKHGGADRPVQVQVAARPGEAVLTVEDGGPGIAPEDLPHVFERFYRADKSRSSGGAGLGLSIARSIVEAHGGSIEAANSPAGGARFTVVLPAA